MIEANSLRIGNWVEYKGGRRSQVSSIDKDGRVDQYLDADGGIGCDWADDLTPIEISPAILEAAGFVKENMVATTFVTYTHDEIEGWFDLYFETHTVRFGIADYEVTNCRYVHQLQNLCSSLGHELPITLP